MKQNPENMTTKHHQVAAEGKEVGKVMPCQFCLESTRDLIKVYDIIS